MKKLMLAGLTFLLLALGFLNVPKVSATEDEERFSSLPGLPEDIPREPLPANFIAEDYLNTTNPSIKGNPFDEYDEAEGNRPFYVLVFADEEERAITRDWFGQPLSYISWAIFQIERGDESLIANFGIDIRILGFPHWNSDNSKKTMEQLWYDLEAKTGHYLGQWHTGEVWSNYVDAIIGITAQATPGDSTAGLAPPITYRDQGRILTLLKWQVYWMDDNIVQHEASHLFYASDHYQHCCVMAYHEHYHLIIWEDAFWWVNDNIPCCLTAYSWCSTCRNIISIYRSLYENYDYKLVIRHGDPYWRKGTFSPGPGVYLYNDPTTVTISIVSIDGGCVFQYWLINGWQKISGTTSITISVDKKYTVAVYFIHYYYLRPGGVGGGGYPSARDSGNLGYFIGP